MTTRSPGSSRHAHPARLLAYTLPELMIAMAIVLMAMAAAVAGHLMGVRMYQVTEAKLGSNNEAMKSVSRLISEVREATRAEVGQGDLAAFTAAADGQAQSGNAVQITRSAPAAETIVYYLDTNSLTLNRRTSLSPGTALKLAGNITNTVPFAAEDFRGTVNTNRRGSQVISLNLGFVRLIYPNAALGPNALYDAYQVRTKVTARIFQ